MDLLRDCILVKRINKKKNIWLFGFHMIFCVCILFFFAQEVLPKFHDSVRTRMVMVLIFVLMMITITIFMLLCCGKIKMSYEKLFVVTVLLWGVICSMVLPMAVTADGHAHWGTCYSLSNKILNYDLKEYVADNDNGSVWVRSADTDTQTFSEASQELYRIFAERFGKRIYDDGKLYEKTDYAFDLGDAFYYKYVIPALGMTVGRLLRLDIVTVLYLAQLFNIMAFCIIGYISIKIVPYGKAQMISIAMVPMVLETYSSVHYDNALLGLTVLFISLCMYYRERRDKLRFRDVLMLLVVWALIIPNKYVFALLGLYIFLIPVEKWKCYLEENRKRLFFTAIVILLSVIYVLLKYHKHFELFFGEGNADVISLRYAVTHPAQILSIYVRTFSPRSLCNKLFHLMGGYVGHNQFYLSKTLIYSFFIIVILGCVVQNGKRISRGAVKIIIGITFIILFMTVLLLLGRYSTDFQDSVFLYGRYMLPTFVMLPVLFGSDECANRRQYGILYIQSLLLCGVMCNILYLSVSF